MLSLVFPVYSKPGFIDVIQTHVSYLRSKGIDTEVIVVGDCLSSKDMADLRAAFPKAILDLSVGRRGKGKAIRDGFAKASGDYVGFLDCDESVLPQDVVRVFDAAKDNDAAIAVRDFDTKRAYHRSFLSSAFNQYVKLVLGLGFSDTQCGLKFFRKDVTAKLLPLLSIDGFAIDAELLFRMKGMRIAVVPTRWSEQSSTTLSPSAIVKMAVDVIRIRIS